MIVMLKEIIIIMSFELKESRKLTGDICHKNLRASTKFWAPVA
jgi:hypothetical protein